MFSKATEYALRATIYLTKNSSEQHKLGLAEIAHAIDSPKSFTAKILQQLSKDAIIISSLPGPRGGFYVTESAKQLPAISILQVMGEEFILEKCVIGLKQCSETAPCPLHTQYKQIRLQLKSLFLDKTIQAFASDIQSGVNFI